MINTPIGIAEVVAGVDQRLKHSAQGRAVFEDVRILLLNSRHPVIGLLTQDKFSECTGIVYSQIKEASNQRKRGHIVTPGKIFVEILNGLQGVMESEDATAELAAVMHASQYLRGIKDRSRGTYRP